MSIPKLLFFIFALATTPVSTVSAQWDTMQGLLLFTSDRDGDKEIFKAKATADADLTEIVQLTFNTDQDDGAKFSPDGQSIAFVRNGKEIWMMDSQGGNQHLVHTGENIDFSPDGSKLVFTDFGGSVYTIDLQTKEVFTVSESSVYVGSNQSPDWSPDGKRIIFQKTFLYLFPHYKNINIVNIDGTGETGLNEYNNIYVNTPRWSPDGSKIIYECDSGAGICMMNPDGSGKTYPFSLKIGGKSTSPVWSPDGAWIIFNLQGSSRPEFNGKLFLFKLDASKAASFTDHPGNNSPTDWLKAPNLTSPNDCLFNWAEKNYPSLFAPARSPSGVWSVYSYRYYSATNAYLGVSVADNHVYYMGADGNLQDVGPLSQWLPLAACQ